MCSLKDFTLEYRDISIGIDIFDDGENIRSISYKYKENFHNIDFDWDLISAHMINPKSNMFETIRDYLGRLPDRDYLLLSSTSITSISPSNSKNPDSDEYLIKNYMRGFAVIVTLSHMICKYRYIRINMPSSCENILTRNYLKILRMAIIIHLKSTDNNDKLLKHGLDFINRWILLFIKGDPMDKTEALVELIANYLCDSRANKEEPNISLEKRISRLEGILGIH